MANNRNDRDDGRRYNRMGKPVGAGIISFLIFVILVIFVYNSYQKGEGNPLENMHGVENSTVQNSDDIFGTANLDEETRMDPKNLQVWYIDVGQGDSQLVRVPHEGQFFDILIDTGEYQYADGLVDFLHELNIFKIDVVINTHPHADHMGGMATIINTFDIGKFYMPHFPEELTPNTVSYEKMLDALENKNLKINDLKKGDKVKLAGQAEIEVLSPSKNAEFDGLNDYSAVMKLKYDEKSFLFTGDIEKAAENALLEDRESLKSDVLSVPHHGSSSSSIAEFLDAVSPQYAIISCGKDNKHNHPNEDVVNRLDERKILTYRTDEDHTLLLKSDGYDVWVTADEKSVEPEGEVIEDSLAS